MYSSFGYLPVVREDSVETGVAAALSTQAHPAGVSFSNGSNRWRLRMEANDHMALSYSADGGQTFLVKHAFTPALEPRQVSDILNQTYFNPSLSTTQWTDRTPLVFEALRFRYLMTGSPAADKTNTAATALSVAFAADSFFGAEQDTLRMKLTWNNYPQGRLRLRLLSTSLYDPGFDESQHGFARMLINAGTSSESYRLTLSDFEGNNSVFVALAVATKSALAAGPIYVDLKRLSNANQLEVTLRDVTTGAELQSALTCNTPFAITTNANGITLPQVSCLLLEEVSLSELNLELEKL